MAERRGIPFLGSPRRANDPAPTIRRPDPQSSVVAWGWYREGIRQDCDDLDFAASRAKVGDGWVWLGLKDPSEDQMEKLSETFDLHPLAIEDAVEGHTRSKLEQFDDTLFTVVSTVAYIDHPSLSETAEIVSTGQIMIFCGPNFAVTVRRGEHSQLTRLRNRLETDDDHILANGPSAVLYGVLDKIVDDYNKVVHEFEQDIDELEEITFSRQRIHNVDEVYQLKRELIEFKRAVVPIGMPLVQLATRPYSQVPEDMRAYFREISDHHVEAREAIASFDEILNTFLQAAAARVSLEDNQDMRKISAAVAILAIPTMIFGMYGMNFQHMPELGWTFGYPLVLSVTFALMLITYLWFHKNRWL